MRRIFAPDLVSVHHIGSTAVPRLPAKPTIDILVIVQPGADIEGYYARMRGLGFECRGECLDAVVPGTPGRHYFPRLRGDVHVVHVHVCGEGHHQIAELLNLRDYLRTHPDDARRYADLKVALAHEFAHDNIGYMRGKDDFVKTLISRAEAWRRAGR